MHCHICGKYLKLHGIRHIYVCDSSDKKAVKYAFIKHNHPNLVEDRDLLIQKYIVDKYSIKDLSIFLGISPVYIPSLLEYYDIPQRNIKEACGTTKILSKRRATTLSIYGVTNASLSPIIKERKKQTFLKNYGVSNIFATDKFKMDNPAVMMEKYGAYSLPNRYGKMQEFWDKQTQEYKRKHMRPAIDAYLVAWHNMSDEERTAIIKKRGANGSPIGIKSSSLEERLSRILLSLNISHIRQKWIKRKSYDFLLEHTNIIIEVNGDFFHANPDIYVAEELLHFPGLEDKVTASTIWLKDLEKKNIAERYGYTVHYIWESDFNRLSDLEIGNIVKNIIFEKYKSAIITYD